MEIPLYLAMTAAEFAFCDALPQNCAWMACHFSPYGTGITNLPTNLPKGSLLILDDSTPICGHDPQRIATELAELYVKFHPSGILLDFQRSGYSETVDVAAFIVDKLPRPVCVSDIYAKGLDCPVFLPPPRLTCRLEDHLVPWGGREIWLEASRESLCCTVTENGCCIRRQPYLTEMPLPFSDSSLHCHYRIEEIDGAARFYLQRTAGDLSSLLEEAAASGVTTAVGLWQELN